MMLIMFSGGSGWFSLGLGVFLIVEALVFFGLQKRAGAKRRAAKGQTPMLLCLGIMFTTRSAAHMLGWTGSALSVIRIVGMVCAAATVVFAIRLLVKLDFSKSPTAPPIPPE